MTTYELHDPLQDTLARFEQLREFEEAKETGSPVMQPVYTELIAVAEGKIQDLCQTERVQEAVIEGVQELEHGVRDYHTLSAHLETEKDEDDKARLAQILASTRDQLIDLQRAPLIQIAERFLGANVMKLAEVEADAVDEPTDGEAEARDQEVDPVKAFFHRDPRQVAKDMESGNMKIKRGNTVLLIERVDFEPEVADKFRDDPTFGPQRDDAYIDVTQGNYHLYIAAGEASNPYGFVKITSARTISGLSRFKSAGAVGKELGFDHTATAEIRLEGKTIRVVNVEPWSRAKQK